MAKSSKEQIEKDERLVLSELQKNGRVGFDVIAKKYGFSRQKVWRIVNRLEHDKTIVGYRAVVDNKKLGLKRFVMLISVRGTFNLLDDNDSFEMLDGIVEDIKSLGVSVNNSLVTHGMFDWVLDVTTDGNIEMVKKCEQKMYNVLTHGDLIKDIVILQVLMEQPVVL